MRQRRSRGLTDVHPAQHSVAISAGGDIRKIVTTPDVVPGLPPRVESDAAVAIGRGIRNCRSPRGQSTCETLYILQPDRVKAGVIHPDIRNTRPPPLVAGAISEKGNATDLVFADIFTTVHAEPHSHLDLIPVGAPILDGATNLEPVQVADSLGSPGDRPVNGLLYVFAGGSHQLDYLVSATNCRFSLRYA